MPNIEKYYEKKNNKSYSNEFEAECIKKILCLLEKNLTDNNSHKSIGIITFYDAQVKLIEEKLINNGYYKQFGHITLSLIHIFISGGIVAGTVIVCSADSLDAVSKSVLTQNLLKTSEVKTIIQIYINAFLPLAAALTIQYICGFSALGQPLTIAGIIYRGVSTGVSAVSYTHLDVYKRQPEELWDCL